MVAVILQLLNFPPLLFQIIPQIRIQRLNMLKLILEILKLFLGALLIHNKNLQITIQQIIFGLKSLFF